MLKFPRALMSLTELKEMGFPERSLRAYVKGPDFPKIEATGGGKFLVVTADLLPFIDEYNQRKELERERLKSMEKWRKKKYA